MKKVKKADVVAAIIIAAVMIAAIVWFMVTPAKTEPECTTEYVNRYGDKDCMYKVNSNEIESEQRMQSQYR